MSKPKAVLNLELTLSGQSLRGLLAYMQDRYYRDPMAAAKSLFAEYKELDCAIKEVSEELDAVESEVVMRTMETLRLLVDESARGYASEDQIVDAMVAEGISADAARKALKAMHRANSVYAKGGAGTYAPLN